MLGRDEVKNSKNSGYPTCCLSRKSDGQGGQGGVGSEPSGVKGDGGGWIEASAAEDSANETDGEDENGVDDGDNEEADE